MYYFFDIKLDIDEDSKPELVKEFLLSEVNAIFAVHVRNTMYHICSEIDFTVTLKKKYAFIKDVTLVHFSDFITEMTPLKFNK